MNERAAHARVRPHELALPLLLVALGVAVMIVPWLGTHAPVVALGTLGGLAIALTARRSRSVASGEIQT